MGIPITVGIEKTKPIRQPLAGNPKHRLRRPVEKLEILNNDVAWLKKAFCKNKANFYSSPLIAGGHLYAARESGTIFVIGLKGKFEVVSEIDMKDRIIASPIAVSGRILSVAVSLDERVLFRLAWCRQ